MESDRDGPGWIRSGMSEYKKEFKLRYDYKSTRPRRVKMQTKWPIIYIKRIPNPRDVFVTFARK